jgi:hypothetical protein
LSLLPLSGLYDDIGVFFDDPLIARVSVLGIRKSGNESRRSRQQWAVPKNE